MSITSEKTTKRIRRHARIRAKVHGTAECPRLAVFRSNRFIYAQLIDDDAGKTLVSADTRNAKGKTGKDRAEETGKVFAEDAKKKDIKSVVFDRGGFQYRGAIVAFADAARKGGLSF